MTKPEEILQFWFQGIDDDTAIDKNKAPFKNWFIKNPRFDEEIRGKFESDLLKAAQGEGQGWPGDARGQLALVILFDQLSRNSYRGTPKMFAFDGQARDIAQGVMKLGQDKTLARIQRTFLYMPFMHAEDLGIQTLSVKMFSALVEECRKAKPENAGYFEYNLGYARRHHEIIERFGRFPHRNAVLGRASTREEEEFLKTPSSSF